MDSKAKSKNNMLVALVIITLIAIAYFVLTSGNIGLPMPKNGPKIEYGQPYRDNQPQPEYVDPGAGFDGVIGSP